MPVWRHRCALLGVNFVPRLGSLLAGRLVEQENIKSSCSGPSLMQSALTTLSNGHLGSSSDEGCTAAKGQSAARERERRRGREREREGEGGGQGEGAQTSLPLHKEDTQSRLARPLRKLAKSIFHNLMPVRMPVRALL